MKTAETKNPDSTKKKKKSKKTQQNKERIILLSKSAVYNTKKSRFIKKQEASGLLSSLGLKTPLN